MFPSRIIAMMGTEEFKDEHSLYFGGTDEYIDTGQTFNTTFVGSYSVSLWVKPTDGQTSTTQMLFGSKNDVSGTAEDFIYLGILNTGKLKGYHESDDTGDNTVTDNAIFVDDSTQRVGIGLNNPESTLSILGDISAS